MYPDQPQLAISRVLDAPRALVFRAFTDPDHLATWWGPSGNTLPRDEIEFDVRPGGFQRWTEVAAAPVSITAGPATRAVASTAEVSEYFMAARRRPCSRLIGSFRKGDSTIWAQSGRNR